MAPGDLIAPVELSEGDLVQALDLDGFWYNAKVLQKRGCGASMRVKVRFTRFSASHDQEYCRADQGVRERLPAASLKAEQRDRIYQLVRVDVDVRRGQPTSCCVRVRSWYRARERKRARSLG